MFRKLIVTTTAAIALAACGGSKSPGTDQVQNDLNNPSGSVKSKQSVAGAYNQQTNSNQAAGLAAGGFAGGGFGLAASNPWSRFSFHNVARPLVDRWRAQAIGQSYQPLRSAQDVGSCFDPSQISGSGGETGGSFSITVDFDSCAQANGVTGKIEMNGEVEIDQAAGTIHYKVDQTLTALCAEGTCVTGEMSMESDISISGDTASGSFIAGWYFTVTENGKTYHTKGGMKLRATAEGAGQFDYVVYVKDEAGNEVSLVVSIEGDGQGNGGIKIKGTDGEINCTIMSDGSGMCTGDITWDAAYIDTLESDPTFDLEG